MSRLQYVSFLVLLTTFCFGQAQLVKDLNTTPASIRSANTGPFFAKSNGLAYFSLQDSLNRSQLWRTDATAQGTFQITNLLSVAAPSTFGAGNPTDLNGV